MDSSSVGDEDGDDFFAAIAAGGAKSVPQTEELKEAARKWRKHQASVRWRERQRRLRENGAEGLPRAGLPGRRPPPWYSRHVSGGVPRQYHRGVNRELLNVPDHDPGWFRVTPDSKSKEEADLRTAMRHYGVPSRLYDEAFGPENQWEVMRQLNRRAAEENSAAGELRRMRSGEMLDSYGDDDDVVMGQGGGFGRVAVANAGGWRHALVK